MSRPPHPKVITANALVEGDVVYLTAAGAWARTLEAAEVFTDEAVAEDVLLSARGRSGEVVGAYLMDVSLSDGRPRPVHFREVFRATGPSNRFHGKQAEV